MKRLYSLLVVIFSFFVISLICAPTANAAQLEEGLFGNAGWGGGNNKIWWNIDDKGVVTIRPLNSATSAGGAFLSKNYDVTGRADKTQLANTVYQWPWQKYRSSITKVIIYGKIYTDSNMKLNKMFANYPKLEEIDMKGLELVTLSGQSGQSFFSRVSEADEMFANCPNLTKVDLSGLRNNGGLWSMKRMFMNDPKLKIVILNNSGFKTRASSSNGVMMQGFFYGSDNLEYVDFSNITVGGRKNTTQYALSASAYMVPGDDYPNLTNKYSDVTDWNDYAGFDQLFLNKTKLTTVKLNNTKVDGMKGFASMFENCTSLDAWDGTKGLDMKGFAPSDATDMRNMFKNTGFTKLDVSSFGKLKNIVNMNGFIEGVSDLEELYIDNLDNSNIGPYNKKHRLASLIENSWTSGSNTYYEYNIDPIYPRTMYSENTRILERDDGGSQKDRYITDIRTVTKENSMITGAIEYGREIFGKGVYDIPAAFPKLKHVSAKNSNVWMVKNNRGLAGNEYYSSGNDTEILYLFNKTTDFTPDGKSTVKIDSKRDYVDMITDRDGINKHTIYPVVNPLPDATKNLNIVNNFNLNGAGHLAPGVYEISNTDWVTEVLKLPKTYYRIAYIGKVPFKIEGIEAVEQGQTSSDPELVLRNTTNYDWLTTRSDIKWPKSGNYTIDRTNKPIRIIYEDAAIDVNGKKHNVIITIKKITFKNLERIPTHEGNEREHDSNKYIDYHPTSSSNENDQSKWTTKNTGYYRTILTASRSEGVNFRNYVRVGNGNTSIGSKDDWQVLSGGSGTDIDFTVEIEKANPDTSFVFHAEDLDIAESQNWNKPNNDQDYDNLPVDKAIYGIGGESFVLGEGNDLKAVIFAEQTGLELVSKTKGLANTVITTGSDPNTPWSEFAVKASANGASYTWESGIACNTYALVNTSKLSVGQIQIEPVAKVLEGGTLQKDQFEFTLTPDGSVAGNKATGSSITAKNDANGNVSFGAFKFDEPKVNIEGTTYYPGTVNDATNTHGNGTHIKHTYAWIVKEKDGGDPNIEYDLDTKKLKVVISTPENDAEMLKGIKAEIYVNEKLVKTVWSNEVENNKFVASVVFKNVARKEITLKKTWIEDNNYNIRPDDIKGYITYQTGSGNNTNNTTVRTEANGWLKNGDVWIYKFKIPASATVINWGEDVLKEYEFKKEKQEGTTDVYPMTNTLKKYNLTISKKVTGNKGDKNKEFNISVKILNEGGSLLTGTFKALVNGVEQDLTATDSGIKLSLKNDDKVVIKDIRIGYKYIVEEEDTEYIEYYNVVSNGKVIKNTTKGIKYESTMDKDYTITFTNDNDKLPEKKNQASPENNENIPQTGDNIVRYFAILMLSALGMIKGVTYIRKHNHS